MNTIIEDEFINLDEEVEEQAMSLLSSFIEKIWERIDDEPSIEDYYNF